MNALTHVATKERFTLFDSGGPRVEIGNLASLISKEIEVSTIYRNLDPSVVVDDYYPRSQQYEELLNSMGLMPESLEVQIRKTVQGHRNQIDRVI